MKEEKLYKNGKKVGLTKREINIMLDNNSVTKEKTVLTMGPYPYTGTHYGTISIKDF